MINEKSEFGKGLTYCLGLFLAHSDRFLEKKTMQEIGYNTAWMWFCGAIDHLYELRIEQAPKHLQKRLQEFSDKCFKFRDNMNSTNKDVEWALNEAKELLIEIDNHLGVETSRGRWE